MAARSDLIALPPHLAARRLILLDMDGPLAAFEVAFWRKVRELGVGTDVEPYPQNQTRRFASDHIPNRRERAIARRAVEAPGWFRDLPVTRGATEGVALLLSAADDAGVAAVVCSKPLDTSPTCIQEKRAWLREWFPELAADAVFVADKSTVPGEVLLDDAPKLSWLPRATWEPKVFPEPYNQTARSPWTGLPTWTWTDPLADLHPLLTP